jgi:hypothetical protein
VVEATASCSELLKEKRNVGRSELHLDLTKQANGVALPTGRKPELLSIAIAAPLAGAVHATLTSSSLRARSTSPGGAEAPSMKPASKRRWAA